MTPQAKELVSILEHAKNLMEISQKASVSYINEATYKISQKASVRYINEAIYKIMNDYVII